MDGLDSLRSHEQIRDLAIIEYNIHARFM